MTLQMEIALCVIFMLIYIVIFVIGLFRLPRIPRNFFFQLTCLFLIGWLACDFVRMTSRTLFEYNLEFSLGLIFVQLAAASIFLFAVSYYRLPFMPSSRARLLFFVFPGITAVIAFVPALRPLICDFTMLPHPMSLFVSDLGPWFWIQAVYCYLIYLISAILVVYGHLRIPKFYRFPSTLIVFAISLIPAIHIVRFAGLWGIPEFSFALVPCVSIVLAHIALINNDENIFIRYARGSVFHYQSDYVLVLNKDDYVIDSNPNATAWFRSQGIKLDFHSLNGIMNSLALNGATIKPGPEGEDGTDISFQSGEFPLVLNLRVHEMDDKQGNKIGSLAVFSDVSGNRGLLDMLEEKAGMDPLTGIANRTSYVGAKNRLNNPEHLPLSVIICDVNGLKAVNDTLGHKHGDKFIQIIAKTLESVCPKSGFLARIGGDEFIFLLPGTDAEAAYILIDQIREALMHKNEEVLYDLSVALGAATKNTEEQDLDEIIDIADGLMYENKKRIKES